MSNSMNDPIDAAVSLREEACRRAVMRALGLSDTLPTLGWDEVLRAVMQGVAERDVAKNQLSELLSTMARRFKEEEDRLERRGFDAGIAHVIDCASRLEAGGRVVKSRTEAPSAPASSEPEVPVRIGGDPPAPEIGMVFVYANSKVVVSALPWSWGASNPFEVRAPWGGPVIWRKA